MWFDSHCHLLDVPGEPAEVLERARAAGVEGLLVVGVDAEDSKRVADAADGEVVWAGAAWHPTGTKGWEDDWIEPIDTLLARPEVRAVGESGIDLYWDKSYFDDQRRAFVAHIELSRRHDKALVIHTRESVDETLEILENVSPPPRLIFHCWSGDLDQLRRVLDLGAYVSFAGNATFKSADALREAARAVPSDRLLVETDAPYLAPEPMRGRKNEPAFVVHTGARLAEVRSEDEAHLAEVTTANARRVLGLDG